MHQGKKNGQSNVSGVPFFPEAGFRKGEMDRTERLKGGIGADGLFPRCGTHGGQMPRRGG